MTGCTPIQQRVKITWLSEIAIWRHCTEPRLFESIFSPSDFPNKRPSNCTDLRCKDFCVLRSASSQGWAEPQFRRSPVSADGSFHGRFLWTPPQMGTCLTVPWELSPMHSAGRCDSVPGIMSVTVCTKISSWLRPAKLTMALLSSVKGALQAEPASAVNRQLAFWRNGVFTGMCMSQNHVNQLKLYFWQSHKWNSISPCCVCTGVV